MGFSCEVIFTVLFINGTAVSYVSDLVVFVLSLFSKVEVEFVLFGSTIVSELVVELVQRF